MRTPLASLTNSWAATRPQRRPVAVTSRARSAPQPGSRRAEIEDYRLAQWVRAVVQRWTVTGVPPRDRTWLFANLLHELVAARTQRTSIGRIVDVAPETYADQLHAAHLVVHSDA